MEEAAFILEKESYLLRPMLSLFWWKLALWTRSTSYSYSAPEQNTSPTQRDTQRDTQRHTVPREISPSAYVVFLLPETPGAMAVSATSIINCEARGKPYYIILLIRVLPINIDCSLTLHSDHQSLITSPLLQRP